MIKLRRMRTLLVITIVLTMLLALGACNKGVDLPELSIKFIDGDTTITVTEKDLKGLELYDFSSTSKGEVSYYKGVKISDLFAKLNLANKDEITSLLVISSDAEEYGKDLPALPASNYANAYFALFYSATADGEYEFLSESNGPVRLFDMTEGTDVKSIKQVGKVQVNRGEPDKPAEDGLPTFSIDVIDGETTITLTNADIKDLELYGFSNTDKNDVTSYFQGVKISEVLEVLDIDVEDIASLAISSGDYSQSLSADNFDSAYLAIFFSETEDGEYELLSADNGPTRAYDTTEGTGFKSVKQVDKIQVLR